jgi:ATP-dependent RNA helicase RhlE
MNSFQELKLSNQLLNAIEDLGFSTPTPIQADSYKVVLSGRDMVGIAQTGTGKTFAYMLPILKELKYSLQITPRVLVIVPTRELVQQVVQNIESYSKYMDIRVVGVFGGVNINRQRRALDDGCDIVVATPGRFYDLALSRALQLKAIQKVVIDEVDVMLDLGFRFQLTNIFELLPEKRQNIMFSATMTEDVEKMIEDYFVTPVKVSIAVSGTPLDNISQTGYMVDNFYTKVNLLNHLLEDKEEYKKVLVFVSHKRTADRLFEGLKEKFENELCVIHSNKTQNYRMRSIKQFDEGENRIMVATDVMARGMDLDRISHVINMDTPMFPENYMHRIGRTGRAEQTGKSLLFTTAKENRRKEDIEELMNYEMPMIEFPEEVEISKSLTPDEQPDVRELNIHVKLKDDDSKYHEKSEKNQKTNQGGSYRRTIAKKYKKPQTRGDKNFNRRFKKK